VTCTVIEPGLRSGMTIRATNSVLGYSGTTFEIQSVQRDFQKAGKISYFLTLGKFLSAFGEQLVNSPNVRDTEQYVTKNTGELIQESSDDGSQGAVHRLKSYNTTDEYMSAIELIKSHTTTPGELIETVDGEELGILRFKGHNEANEEYHGAFIRAIQDGAAGSYVPTVLDLVTYNSSSWNEVSIRIYSADGRVGINKATGAEGQLHIDQNDASAAIPVLVLDQADVDEPFIGFIGTAAAGDSSRSIINEGDQDVETLEGWLMIEVEDVGNQIADQKYAIPFYSVYNVETGAAPLAGAGALAATGMVIVLAAGAIAGAGALTAAGSVIVP